ncbi:hypothetical protein [Silvibacterium sp.]|uniref:hypothetical protein n=1 Tax=Silvibacterium sp. TaxID=1964179 RepID=UPI0039E71189
MEQALGITPLLSRLKALQQSGQGGSLDALNLRQQLLERILAADFESDAVVAHIDNEASYVSEKRYLLEQRNQKESNALNLITFATSGALGAAGAAMQLTNNLNHAGVALQAAAGGSSLILTGVQLKSGGGRQAIDSPYNMLAQILGQTPNAESRYPPIVVTYLNTPRADGRSTTEALTEAWQRLGRLQEKSKQGGTSVPALVADRTSSMRLSDDELANREAMLHDLHAVISTLHSDLQQVLEQVELSHTTEDHK